MRHRHSVEVEGAGQISHALRLRSVVARFLRPFRPVRPPPAPVDGACVAAWRAAWHRCASRTRSRSELATAPDWHSLRCASPTALRMSAATSKSIYDQIGGAPAVEATVDAFYKRVLADPLLLGFFAKTNMVHQRDAQIKFVTTALGGPQIYRGRTMFHAHKKFDLEQKHFDRVVYHMVETLRSLKVPEHLIAQIGATLAPLARDIVNTPTVSLFDRVFNAVAHVVPLLFALSVALRQNFFNLLQYLPAAFSDPMAFTAEIPLCVAALVMNFKPSTKSLLMSVLASAASVVHGVMAMRGSAAGPQQILSLSFTALQVVHIAVTLLRLRTFRAMDHMRARKN